MAIKYGNIEILAFEVKGEYAHCYAIPSDPIKNEYGYYLDRAFFSEVRTFGNVCVALINKGYVYDEESSIDNGTTIFRLAAE